jgi:hypothetical protein
MCSTRKTRRAEDQVESVVYGEEDGVDSVEQETEEDAKMRREQQMMILARERLQSGAGAGDAK